VPETAIIARRSYDVCRLMRFLLCATVCSTIWLVGSGAPEAGAPPRLPIPGGLFTQGGTREDDERPVRKTTLKPFSIDPTEVTRGAYARCVATKRCKAPRATTDAGDANQSALPVTGVDWNDAQAYCRFVGGRLPTEAEWEKAARGDDAREYPWGNDAECGRANWGNFEGEGPCADKNPGRPVAVGQYTTGASPYGVLDMGGNVWEWVADRYEDDPKRRVVRGGSCCSFFVGPRAANRNAWAVGYRDGDLGFRCAYR
jgi:formylglycine-generating enzyme required for sulfatase activity